MSDSSQIDQPPSRPEFLVVLGLIPPVTVEDVKQAYLDKAKDAHPDRGGTAEQFIRLQSAFERATEYARFKAGRTPWLSSWVEQYAQQEIIIAEIREMGGTVEVESCDWIAPSIGADFATVLDRIAAIRMEGPKIDDAVLLHLGAQRGMLAGLHRMELVDTHITSVGLRQLHGFDSLRHLDLSGTRVGRRAVNDLLHDLGRLESLALDGTGIGWWSRLRLRLAHRGLVISA